MRELPVAAQGFIGCAVLAAALCAAPAAGLGADAPWGDAAALATLYAVCERARHCPVQGRREPIGGTAFFPVLLAGVFLLPPPLAALAAVPGGLTAPAEARSAAARRLWHAAELALACWVSAHICQATGHHPLSAPQFPALLLPAAATAAAFCGVIAVLDGGVLVAAERHPPRTAWRGGPARSLPPYLVHGLAGLMMAVLWRSPYGPPAALLVLLPMYLSCWVLARYHRERAAHRATIRALVQAVDIKDRYTRGHSERVGRASVMIARELGMAEDRVEVLRFAGILHDVGKLGVPTRLLRKDGPLTPEERRVIELHPEYGHEIVRGIGFLGEARAAILHHHERLDGRGYPYGLTGRQIPEFARVVAVADAFDAMTSTRSYRRARPVAAAVAELRNCAGAQFDPRMVRALAASLDRHGWHPGLVMAADADPVAAVAVDDRTDDDGADGADPAAARCRAQAGDGPGGPAQGRTQALAPAVSAAVAPGSGNVPAADADGPEQAADAGAAAGAGAAASRAGRGSGGHRAAPGIGRVQAVAKRWCGPAGPARRPGER